MYRVLNQLNAAGLVTRRSFQGYKWGFELSQQHHDHLICLTCGKVIEFQDEVIENRQTEIAQSYNICLTSHNLYLYGYCLDKESSSLTLYGHGVTPLPSQPKKRLYFFQFFDF